MKKIVSANQMRDGSSVIQTNPQKGLVMSGGSLADDTEKQCRELLARRPSYRKLLKELSSSDPDTKSRLVRETVGDDPGPESVARNFRAVIPSAVDHGQSTNNDLSSGSEAGSEDDSDSRDVRHLSNEAEQVGSSCSSEPEKMPPSGHMDQVSHQQQLSSFGFPLQIAGIGGTDGGATDRAYQHALAMNNAAAQSGSPLQHRQDLSSHPGQGQHLAALLPSSTGYQVAPGVILPGSGGGGANSISAAMAVMGQGSSPPVGEEVARKREMRLLKNREAARECRRKKKEYVKCLENRVAVLEAQNKALIDELKSLKELYCQQSVVPLSGLGSKNGADLSR